MRAARPGERAAVVKFLKGEDPEDYVITWMDRFEKTGRFYLLIDGKKIAGVFHGKLAPDGSAWMSAARVNNAYRGHGWMMKMNAYAVRTPALKSAHAARMLIVHDNKSSLRAAEKGGFHVRTSMSFLEWERPKRAKRRSVETAEPSGWRKATPAEFLKAARGSPIIAGQGGLAYMSFNGAFELNARSAAAARPWLYVSEEHGPLMAAMFDDLGERWMAIQPFRGGKKVARALKAFVAEQKGDSFTVFLPSSSAVRRPFIEAGIPPLEWASRVFIFERALPWPTSSGAAATKPSRP